MEETKIIYHIDDEDTPYLIKLPIPADRVTLGDFKNALNRPNYKFFFKSMDDDFGVVKEEIIDDDTHLPCFNGRVVSWLVAAESSVSDSNSQCADSQVGDHVPPERLGGIGDSRPPSFHANPSTRDRDSEACDTCTETESVMSSRRDHRHGVNRNPQYDGVNRNPQYDGVNRNPHHDGVNRNPHHGINVRDPHRHPPPPRINGHSKHGRSHGFDATSSVMSSDIDTTSFFDSEDDASSRFSTATETTGRSSKMYGRHRRRRRRHRMPPISRASSFSSITDSTMSLNIITVTLNMDTVNFLGISIVGQSNKGGDGGIYVGSIMKGGAVAQDGRIEPGDMILEVNGVSFENMTNDDAVRTLREAVQKPGPITLVVAKCWDPNPKVGGPNGYFTIPRQEPVRPIDPSAWVAHTEAVRGMGGYGRPGPPSISTMTSTSSSLTSSLADSERFDDMNLTVNTDMATIVRAMAQPDSGLEIRDRMWLKITIPNAFMGSDLVDWLHTHVEGFADRRDARKYATNLLKAGYIRHTVNKLTFSEQCYYVFGDLCGVPDIDFSSDILSSGSNLLPHMTNNLSSLTLEDIDSVSEADAARNRDTVGPLPPPAWTNQYSTNPYGPSYMPPPPLNYAPPYGFPNDSASYVSMPMGNTSAVESMQSGSANRDKTCACIVGHTYKQIKKLWENPDKANTGQNGVKPLAKFDDDIERSTSSSAGSSTSGNSQSSQRAKSKSGSGGERKSPAPHPMKIPLPPQLPGGSGPLPPGKGIHGLVEGDANGQRISPTEPLGRPLPPPPRDLSSANPELNASRQSFRMAMGNPYSEDTLQMMGDL